MKTNAVSVVADQLDNSGHVLVNGRCRSSTLRLSLFHPSSVIGGLCNGRGRFALVFVRKRFAVCSVCAIQTLDQRFLSSRLIPAHTPYICFVVSVCVFLGSVITCICVRLCVCCVCARACVVCVCVHAFTFVCVTHCLCW